MPFQIDEAAIAKTVYRILMEEIDNPIDYTFRFYAWPDHNCFCLMGRYLVQEQVIDYRVVFIHHQIFEAVEPEKIIRAKVAHLVRTMKEAILDAQDAA